MQCPKCKTHQSPKETCGWCGERLPAGTGLPLSEFVDLRAERVAIRNALERLLSLRDRAAAPDYEVVEPTNDEWLAAWDDARKALNADA